jgi:hypothetical protein
VLIHLGWNKWATVISPDEAMQFNLNLGVWQFVTNIPAGAAELDVDFNDGSGTWDNNSSADYRFAVATNPVVSSNIPPFVLDGNFDYPNYLLASSGMTLYAAVRGTTLYVATWSPGTNGPNDHFIFVTDQLLPALAGAPWAKAGLVAVSTNKPFLAGESTSAYLSWFVNGVATNWPCAKSATNSGALEGTLDLVGAFGYLPTNIYLCAAAYITTNGGPLVAECPAGTGPNIGTNGFLEIPTMALEDSVGGGVFNLLNPAQGFKLEGCSASSNGLNLAWGAMPGRTYQIFYSDSLTNGTWTNLPQLLTNTGPLQTALGYTIPPPLTNAHRFYKIELAP